MPPGGHPGWHDNGGAQLAPPFFYCKLVFLIWWDSSDDITCNAGLLRLRAAAGRLRRACRAGLRAGSGGVLSRLEIGRFSRERAQYSRWQCQPDPVRVRRHLLGWRTWQPRTRGRRRERLPGCAGPAVPAGQWQHRAAGAASRCRQLAQAQCAQAKQSTAARAAVGGRLDLVEPLFGPGRHAGRAPGVHRFRAGTGAPAWPRWRRYRLGASGHGGHSLYRRQGLPPQRRQGKLCAPG